MRKERKLNKAIQNDGAETQGEILNALKREYSEYAPEAVETKGHISVRRKAAMFSALATVAACAVIVPCAVLLPNSGNNSEEFKYSEQNDYALQASEYTLREYSEKIDNKICYIDWYDAGEDCVTFYIVDKSNEIVGLKESVYFSNSDELIYLNIIKSDVHYGIYDNIFEPWCNLQEVSGHTVYWEVSSIMNYALCGVEYNDNKYFITIQDGQDENRLFELVDELFKEK